MKIPTIYNLKPAFQNTLRPIADRLAKAGITANQVTIGAALLSILLGIWIALQPTNPVALICLPVALFIRMALNAIDGMLAREHGQKSNLGGVLNELGDVVSDTALYLPFALHPSLHPGLVLSFVILAVLTEFAGVTTAAITGDRRYDGPMGKSDRAFFWGTLAFLAAIGVPLAPWISWVLGISLILLAWTVVNRVRHGIGH